MAASVNTNTGADLGVQQLNSTSRELLKSGDRITTGLTINGPEDDAATFGIAQAMRGQIAGAVAVKTALAAGESTVATALAAGQSLSDVLIEMKRKIVQAGQSGLDASSRNALQNDVVALRNNLTSIVASAGLNGTNLIKSGASDLSVLSAQDGSTISVGARDMSASGLGIENMTLLTQGGAQSALAAIDTAIDLATASLAGFGSSAQLLEDQNNFTTQIHDGLRAGIGDLIDADLGEQAMNLALIQVQLQLGLQSLAIANAGPRSLLSLFP